MANPEHVRLVREGSEAIARWRSQHPGERLDLSQADLSGANLTGAYLLVADLPRANLSGANLFGAYLTETNLFEADLSGANLLRADLTGADLTRVNLTGVNLTGASLFGADLTEANLSGANLFRADLFRADLSGADLSGADLSGANLSEANLIGANLTDARCNRTTFANCNLSQCLGLESVVHEGPSHIGIDTIMMSKGSVPRAFLLGAGVPREILDALLLLVSGEGRYYRCFISYASADVEFATRLYRDLETEGVPCWKYGEDAMAGRGVWANIDRAIQDNDKTVTICSRSSLERDGVPKEIERVLEKEAALRAENVWRMREAEEQGKKPDLLDEDVLVPVRLDDFVLKEWQHERRADVLAKHILDFSAWRDEAKYKAALRRLLHDLDPKTWGTA